MSDYSVYVNSIANLCVLLETITDDSGPNPSTNVNFNQILPRAIEYAEERMYRELDLLGQVGISTANFVAGTRTLTVPGNAVVVNNVNVITPLGASPTTSGATRNALQRLSLDSLNLFWPQGQSSDSSGIPLYWAMQDNDTMAVAPAPNNTYTVEFIGVTHPATLSDTNTSTLLTMYCSDAFITCSMIFMSMWQKNDAAAQGYEGQYQIAKASIDLEAARQKAQAPQWQPYSPTKAATPPRT